MSSEISGMSVLQMTKLVLRKGQSIVQDHTARRVTQFCTVWPWPLIKPHLPLSHRAAPSAEGADLVHLSRMVISSHLFYCFRFPSGRYLCSRFHANRDDVYRPFRKNGMSAMLQIGTYRPRPSIGLSGTAPPALPLPPHLPISPTPTQPSGRAQRGN